MTVFKVGDRADWDGAQGTVVEIAGWANRQLLVKFDRLTQTTSFRLDGKFFPWQKSPCLVLLERSKRKIKLWINLYWDSNDEEQVENLFGVAHKDEESARSNVTPSANEQWTGTFNLEVFEP